ncbi:threonine aldolase family protein [Nigerium massiliense]|uniref:threonine aldolase family protein n=1 Tax=Nigerium massiliense TaxID=1522317 RepID=UPI00059014C5|nr:threonine aldolase family protein [Nigerium massiliense]
MIDLRSDTVTRPTPGMVEAMAAAALGDDVYAEDPTVNALEQRVAAQFGLEAGLFCVSGSLSNQLGVWSLVEPGQEVLCDAGAHIARAEMGAHAANAGVTMRTWVTDDGVAELAQIEQLLSPDAGPYLVSTGAVELENTHNFGGGTIQPLEHLRAVSRLCRDAGVGLHLDGARIWNAAVATGVDFAEYGALFDTVSVCFSKGLGAPVGSMLLGSAETIARCRVQRKRLGAGWRQAGGLAAAASYALDHHIDRLSDDHAAAGVFAEAVARYAPEAPAAPQTNIVVVPTGGRPATEVVARAAEQGVALSVVGGRRVRAVTHLDVNRGDCERAGEIVGRLLAED